MARMIAIPPRYEPIRRLGQGGGGEVWAVRDRIGGGRSRPQGARRGGGRGRSEGARAGGRRALGARRARRAASRWPSGRCATVGGTCSASSSRGRASGRLDDEDGMRRTGSSRSRARASSSPCCTVRGCSTATSSRRTSSWAKGGRGRSSTSGSRRRGRKGGRGRRGSRRSSRRRSCSWGSRSRCAPRCTRSARRSAEGMARRGSALDLETRIALTKIAGARPRRRRTRATRASTS
jgi:hypothetical protein